MESHDLLDTKVIHEGDIVQRVRRWWRGIHPDRGVITQGWSGWETIEETVRIVPLHRFTVSLEGSPGV